MEVVCYNVGRSNATLDRLNFLLLADGAVLATVMRVVVYLIELKPAYARKDIDCILLSEDPHMPNYKNLH